MTYTNIPKPISSSYTNISKDIASLSLYGQAIYGISKYGMQNNYTNVAKPTTSTYTNIPKPT